MATERRIIDRDIEVYTAFAEWDLARLRRCPPSGEATHRRRHQAAQQVLAALIAYRDAIDSNPNGPR